MRSIFALGVFLSLTSSSWAATVSGVQGRTLLNTGTGFRAVQAPTQAGPGARVVANQGGQGLVQYDDGCTVQVNPGQVYTIAPVSPCQSGLAPPPAATTLGVGMAIVGATIGAVIIANGLNPASP